MSLAQIFRTKPPGQLVSEAESSAHQLKKTLSALDLIAFGVGATIGSGIFALTGTAAAGQAALAHQDIMSTPIINFLLGSPLGREGAGPAIVISFMIAALACGFAAMCYAELAAMIPVSGSAYTFAYASLGELIAWIIGWDLILEYAVGNIAVAVSWSDYFQNVLTGMTGLKLPLWLAADPHTAIVRLEAMKTDPLIAQMYSSVDLPTINGQAMAMNVPAFVIVVLITIVLVMGVQESAIVNTVAVILKVAVVLFFVFFGMGYIHPENWHPFAPTGFAGIMGGAAIVFFSFIGFDAVSSTAEETKNPQKDMPIGMLGSLAICTVLYAAVSLVLTGILPYQKYANDAAPVATAIAATGHSWAHIIVSIGALAGMTSVLLVFQLGQPRIFMAMSRDGLLPKMFSVLHPKYKTPFVPTVLTGLFVGFAALFIDIGFAAELTNIGTLAAFIIVCGGVLILRKTDPTHVRPFKCPLVPLVPWMGIFSCFFLMLSLPVNTWVRFVVWMAMGGLLYWYYGFRHSKLSTSKSE